MRAHLNRLITLELIEGADPAVLRLAVLDAVESFRRELAEEGGRLAGPIDVQITVTAEVEGMPREPRRDADGHGARRTT